MRSKWAGRLRRAASALINKMSFDLVLYPTCSPGLRRCSRHQSRIQTALAQFGRSHGLWGSKWDSGYASVFSATAPNRNLNVDLPNFTTEENRGGCCSLIPGQTAASIAQACHVPPTFALAANSGQQRVERQ